MPVPSSWLHIRLPLTLVDKIPTAFGVSTFGPLRRAKFTLSARAAAVGACVQSIILSALEVAFYLPTSQRLRFIGLISSHLPSCYGMSCIQARLCVSWVGLG